MKTIGSIGDLLGIKSDLAMYILESCTWMPELWEPDSISYVFVLDDDDIGTTTINPIPKEEYLTIDLAAFDLWEYPAIYEPATGYWNVVAILGQEFGCTLFMSAGFVASIPSLYRKLMEIMGKK